MRGCLGLSCLGLEMVRRDASGTVEDGIGGRGHRLLRMCVDVVLLFREGPRHEDHRFHCFACLACFRSFAPNRISRLLATGVSGGYRLGLARGIL